ncbi:MAG: choice-of-anchor J domain-containing protein [Bacteroidales bacterium]|nr:choice-of-anchor J domain-containing protein [Bacteroidales bacterium]
MQQGTPVVSASAKTSREPVRGLFFEDVESHTNFTINSTVNGWSHIDVDGSITWGIQGCTFPGAYEPMVCIVFNPSATTPPLANADPHSGSKYFAFFDACLPIDGGTGPNNDWLISPLLSEPTKLSFWAKSYTETYGLERMQVGYSKTGTAQSDFTFFTTGYVEVPATAWTEYEYDIPEGTKYIVIRCVSSDSFFLMVDDIKIEQEGTPPPTCDPASNLAVKFNAACDEAELTWYAPSKGRGQVLWDNTAINSGTGGLISSYWTGNAKGVFTADDFDANSEWTIEKIYAEGFSNAPSELPTKMSVAIYSNNSGKPGTQIYREDNISVTDGAKPEMVLPTPFTLPGPGKYWISIAGTYDINITDPNSQLDSYRWNIYHGTVQKGLNFQLKDETGWFGIGSNWVDANTLVTTAYSMFFRIEGTQGDVPPPTEKFNVYRDDVKIASNLNALSYTDKTFDQYLKHTWKVTVVCEDDESAPVSITKDPCNTPPTCSKVTGATATIADCNTATITWNAVPEAVAYKVYRGVTLIEEVTGTTATEEADFAAGESYVWHIKTVCAYTESEPEATPAATCSVGIEEFGNTVAIFPNPANSTVTINAPGFAKVEVYNTVGQLVETRTINSVDVSTYNTGIYFFKVYDNNNNSVTKRVMVTK